ncbi:MAG: YCF48-related protein [Thermodesulfobacteriota bacterium]|nr:YCF48-related protein [Thermodesulfobacteriota bacterium]
MGNKTRVLCAMVILLGCVMVPFQSYAADGIGDTNLFASAVISDNAYILTGDRGSIYLSENKGDTWKAVESHTSYALADVCFPDGSQGWITGQAGMILYTANGGKTWVKQDSNADRYLLAVDFFDAENGCAVGANSTVVVTSDGGRTWKNASFDLASDLGGEFSLFDVRMLDETHICMVGDLGRIFISDDDGDTWQEAESPLYDPYMMIGRVLYGLTGDKDMLFAVGIDSTLVRSFDMGRTWQEADCGVSGPELFCVDLCKGSGLAAGSGGALLQTSDNGMTWKVSRVPEEVTRGWLSGVALDVDASGRIHGVIVGQYGAVGIVAGPQVAWQGTSMPKGEDK